MWGKSIAVNSYNEAAGKIIEIKIQKDLLSGRGLT
jgi:hypothetical protein